MGRAIITLGKGVGGGGGGNVTGPASSTDTALVRFSGTTGKIIQDSNVTLANSGTSLVFSGVAGLSSTGANPITFSPGGTEKARLAATTGNLLLGGLTTDGTGVLQFPAATTSAGGITLGTDVSIYRSGGSAIIVNAALTIGTSSALTLNASGSNGFLDSAGSISLRTNGTTTALTIDSSQTALFAKKISSYNGISTAGWGAEIVQGYTEVTAQSAAGNITTYTVGAADGVFRVSADMSVTAATVLSTTLTVTYTDKANVARTMILPVQQLSGSFIAGGLITATGAWETPTMEIRCKASTAITILTSAGTFNTVVFSAAGAITQVG